MRSVPYLAVVMLGALQALVTVYWEKTNAPRLTQAVADSFYGGLPAWSLLAFSIGWYWLVLPLSSSAWLLLAWRRPGYRRYIWPVAAVSLLGFLSMIYAMYPLHVMTAGY